MSLVGICLAWSCQSPTPGERSQAGIDPRIDRVEAGLVVMGDDQQPQWGETAPLADRMSFYKVPGVSVAVIDDFRIAWARGYGTCKSGEAAPVSAETLFHAGSVAKPVSAAAALRLVQESRLDLDANVNDRLRSWTVPENELTRLEKVTLRRLLSHSAGLQDGFTDRSSQDAMPKYLTPAGTAPSVTLQQLLDAEPGVDVDGATRVTSVPGSRYRYANADYAVLELLLRDVTETPTATLMQETVLGPLGMESSTYAQPLPEELRARAAVEHDFAGRPIPGDRLHFPLVAAGSLWTTPSDLARFTLEIVQAYRGQSSRLLSQEIAVEMLSRQASIEQSPLAEAAGLGFELSGQGEDLCILHTGGTWGSTSLLWAYPETGRGAVIMTNSASGSLLRFEILLGIAAEYGWPIHP